MDGSFPSPFDSVSPEASPPRQPVRPVPSLRHGQSEFTGRPAYANDTLNGRGGNDTLIGGLNNDTLDGGAGSDYMFGGPVDYSGTENGYGNDTLTGGTGADYMYGGGGNDTFFAAGDTSTADYLDGGTGTDTVGSSDGDETTVRIP